MKTKPRTKLTLSKLLFVSAVDMPAQETAIAAIIKRAKTGDAITALCRVAKVDEQLGIVMGFAFTTTVDGKPYYDLQGDAISDEDVVKVAAEFMASGGYTDEMHDEQPDGKVVFCWPLTAEIAKSLAISTSKTGLLVGIKPSPAVLEKFKSGEYTGFSIGGMGVREAVKVAATTCEKCAQPVAKDAAYCSGCGAAMKRALVSTAKFKKLRAALLAKLAPTRVRKDVLLTDEVGGHQHAIDLDDPAGWCGDRLSTTYATTAGAETGHSHVWTFDATSGAVTIAADSGHMHTVDGVVPPEVLAVFALNERAEDAEQAAAVLERVLDGDVPAGNVSVSVAARAPRENSTHLSTDSKVGAQGKEPTVNFAKMLSLFLALTPAQHAHVTKMAPDEVEAFLGKTAAERDAIVKAALDNDPVVYKTTAGIEVRKSAGEFAVEMAKQADASAKAAAEATALVQKRDVELEQEKLEKRADAEIPLLKGSKPHRAALLKAVSAITDQPTRDAVISMLKSANEAIGTLFKATDHRLRDGFELPPDGATGEGAKPDDSPDVALRKHVEKYQADNKIPTYQQALHKAVREDAKTQELYAAAKN